MAHHHKIHTLSADVANSMAKKKIMLLLHTVTTLGNHVAKKKGKRKVQGVSQSQTAPLPRHKEKEETDKTKQAQIEQMHKSSKISFSSPSEVITMLKGPKAKEQNNTRQILKQIAS